MQVKLTMAELSEAVTEWAYKRGLNVTGKTVTFNATPRPGRDAVFTASIDGVELPAYFGPYR